MTVPILLIDLLRELRTPSIALCRTGHFPWVSVSLRPAARDRRTGTVSHVAGVADRTHTGKLRPDRRVSPRERRARPRLGELLVEAGLVTVAQRDQALATQARDRRRLGVLLTEAEALSEQDLIRVLAGQLGIATVDREHLTAASSVRRLVPDRLARRLDVIPLEIADGTLAVAMADPLDVLALDELRLVTRLRVRPVLACPSTFRERFHEVYVADSQIEELMDLGPLDDPPDLEALGELAENDAPVIRLVNLVIGHARRRGAAEIHVVPSERSLDILFRVHGKLAVEMSPPKRAQTAIQNRIRLMASLNPWVRRACHGSIHMKIDGRRLMVEVECMPGLWGDRMVLALHDDRMAGQPAVDLGLEVDQLQAISGALHRGNGLILIAGPPASGKATTLRALMGMKPESNRICVEHPRREPPVGVSSYRWPWGEPPDWEAALGAVMAQRVDLVGLGALPDRATVETACRASLGRSIVVARFQARDAFCALDQILETGASPRLVAQAVTLVLSQVLVPRLCVSCRTEYSPDARTKALLRGGSDPAGATADPEPRLYRRSGCRKCDGTGFKGGVGLFEVVPVSAALRKTIRACRSATRLRRAAFAPVQGPKKSLGAIAIRRALEGVIDLDSVPADLE